MKTSSTPEVTLEAIETWLATLPANHVVDNANRRGGPCCNCLVANYLLSQGIKNPWVGPWRWSVVPPGETCVATPGVQFLPEIALLVWQVDVKRAPRTSRYRSLTASEALTIVRDAKRNA